MGTNYYLHAPKCLHCGKESEDSLHLGKSSYGWCFGLHIYPELNITTYHRLLDLILERSNEGWTIQDEYGKTKSIEEFRDTVENRRQSGKGMTQDWLSKNYAVKGPNGLARHRLDGRYCLGHGEGTYDYLVGEFS